MPERTISKKQATDIDLLNIVSIQANAESLLAQLKDYEFLKITEEQSRALNNLEVKFNWLVKDITH